MKERLRTTLVLLVLVAATGMAAYKQQVQRTKLVYADSVDMIALTVDDVDISLREMAVYVAYQEQKVQQDALIYDSDKPEKYWNAYTNQHFVRKVAEDAIIDMAVHDEIFYQMAVEEGIALDEAEEVYLMNEIGDFFMDLSDEQFLRLGVQEADVETAMRKIALANKYQSVLSQVAGVEYTSYDYTGESYEALLEEHVVEENKEVWNRISVGSITVNYKKKTVEQTKNTEQK